MRYISNLSRHGDTLVYLEHLDNQHYNLCAFDVARRSNRILKAGYRTGYPNVVGNDAGVYFAAADDNWFHDIWWADLALGITTQITDYFHTHSYPVAMVPDGERDLLAISNLRGEFNLRKFTPDTGDFRKLTDYASPVRGAVYSPDHQQIAYSANATRNTYNCDIYRMDADGFNKERLLSTLAGAVDLVWDWHPGGRYLALSSNYEQGWRAGVLDLEAQDIAWFSMPSKSAPHRLDFSAAGDKLLFASAEGVTVCRVPGGERLPLIISPAAETDAIWWDNQRVVVALADGEVHLHTLAEGTTDRLI